MMRCIFCQKGPAEGVALFRVNAKGQPGVWACPDHINRTDATVDPAVKDIVSALDRRGQK